MVKVPTCKYFLTSQLGWTQCGASALPQTVKQRDKDYNNNRNWTSDTLNHCKLYVASIHMLWCEWGMCVQGIEWERCCVCLYESLSCASELNHFKQWTLSSASLPVLESVREALLPLKVCLQGVGTKTRDPHCKPPLHLSAVPSSQVWALQLFSPLRHPQKLIHEIHDFDNPNLLLLHKNNNDWCICEIVQLNNLNSGMIYIYIYENIYCCHKFI